MASVLQLAGLDARDVVTARHPWLHVEAADQGAALPPEARPRRKPKTWREAMQPAAALAAADYSGGDAAWDAARRLREAALTPSGGQQPSELAGVDASARVPNQMQPQSGEIERGAEVLDGRPAYFGAMMPPPTGVANGVGVPSGPMPGRHPFGAPVGMKLGPTNAHALVKLQLAGLTAAPGPSPLAALPHFAEGGMLAPGDAGIVGEDGEEEIHALPGGGVSVDPVHGAATPDHLALAGLAPATAAANRAANLAALPAATRTASAPGRNSTPLAKTAAALPRASRNTLALAALEPRPAAAASAPRPTSYGATADGATAARLARMAGGPGGYGITGAPPDERAAEDAYQKAADAYAGEKPPTEQSVGYKSPWWRKLAGIAAGAFAGGVANYYAPRGQRANPDIAGNIALEVANPRLARADRTYAQTRQQQGQALPALERGAQIEEQRNAADERGWQAQTEQAYRQQNADNLANYRDQELALRQQLGDQAAELRRQAQQAKQPREQTPFDIWRQQNPAAPVADWFAMQGRARAQGKPPAGTMTVAQRQRARARALAGLESKRQQVYGQQAAQEKQIQLEADTGKISQEEAESQKRALEAANNANYNAAIDAADAQLAAEGVAPSGYRQAGGWAPNPEMLKPGVLNHFSDGSTWRLVGGRAEQVR